MIVHITDNIGGDNPRISDADKNLQMKKMMVLGVTVV